MTKYPEDSYCGRVEARGGFVPASHGIMVLLGLLCIILAAITAVICA